MEARTGVAEVIQHTGTGAGHGSAHAPGVVCHRHVAPVDLQGVVRVGQRHRVRPAIDVLFPKVGFALGPQRERVPIAARHERLHPPAQMRIRRGFAGERKMKPVQQHLAAEGLVGMRSSPSNDLVLLGINCLFEDYLSACDGM